MGFVGEVWQVHKGDESVGEILIDDADFPWLSGKFTAGPAFDAVRELFARELALAQADDEWARWEEVYDEVRRQVALTSPDGPVPEFLLHIEGERAWFRWSDEPFDDDEDGDEAAPGGE
ncbi:hypothetical protein [Streptomyces hokutonensis]|uniref:hypothetical protein n=1 Tax=Streptomyces hokutonensis TaxID=1306990 RepID=UPI000365AF52|nr:hypothetical protein [Streptomyces hokutonensis]